MSDKNELKYIISDELWNTLDWLRIFLMLYKNMTPFEDSSQSIQLGEDVSIHYDESIKKFVFLYRNLRVEWDSYENFKTHRAKTNLQLKPSVAVELVNVFGEYFKDDAYEGTY